jgi:hypothetical protein
MPATREPSRHWFATGSVPGLAIEGRSIDSANKAEARRRAENIIIPNFPAHARRHVEIRVEEIMA